MAEYTYDPIGFRIQARHPVTQETTRYIPNLSSEALYEEETTPSGTAVRAHVWWNGQHLARADGDPTEGATTRYFYHLDHEGSLMAATDSTGAAIWANDYEPFGEGIEQNGTSTMNEAHGFTGKAYDSETGLYYYNARWYDPELGRFVTEDTFAGDPNRPETLNRYVYVVGNPLKYLDPTGHEDVGASFYVKTQVEVENKPGGGQEIRTSGESRQGSPGAPQQQFEGHYDRDRGGATSSTVVSRTIKTTSAKSRSTRICSGAKP